MSFDDKDKLVVLFAFAWVALIYFRRASSRSLPLPPGPKPLPLIGNLLNFPRTLEWETYARWGKEFSAYLLIMFRRTWRLIRRLSSGSDSDIIYVNFAGTKIVVLNSLRVANELLDRRSLKYSSRYVDLPFPDHGMAMYHNQPSFSHGERTNGLVMVVCGDALW